MNSRMRIDYAGEEKPLLELASIRYYSRDLFIIARLSRVISPIISV